MSLTSQQVILGPNGLTGAGNDPSLTFAHSEDLLMGMIGGTGGTALRLPRSSLRRMYPVDGRGLLVRKFML